MGDAPARPAAARGGRPAPAPAASAGGDAGDFDDDIPF
jgi:hypothetical protein